MTPRSSWPILRRWRRTSQIGFPAWRSITRRQIWIRPDSLSPRCSEPWRFTNWTSATTKWPGRARNIPDFRSRRQRRFDQYVSVQHTIWWTKISATRYVVRLRDHTTTGFLPLPVKNLPIQGIAMEPWCTQQDSGQVSGWFFCWGEFYCVYLCFRPSKHRQCGPILFQLVSYRTTFSRFLCSRTAQSCRKFKRGIRYWRVP